MTKTLPSNFKYYDIVLALFVGLMLISNVSAVKLISFNFGDLGHIITDGGAILFPLTYIINDILTEVYGFTYARRAIWMGFFVQVIAVTTFFLVQRAPAAADWAVNQSSFDAIIGFVPRIVLASLVAYLFGEFFNSIILAKLKVVTRGKNLWFRLIGSTVVGEAFDTIVFCLIAFGGILHGSEMVNYIVVGWVFKVSVEVIFLPISYLVIDFLKRSEKVDSYDTQTDFNPLSLTTKSAENRFEA